MQLFKENRHFVFQAPVVLKPLVSVTGRLVACSARISVDGQTDTLTDRQTNYCNPRCACTLRVNGGEKAREVGKFV